MPRASSLLLALFFLALPTFAQQSGTDMTVDVSSSERRLPLNNSVYIWVEVSWSGSQVVEQNAVEIHVPGNIKYFSANDPRVTCSEPTSRPIRCSSGVSGTEFRYGVQVETQLTTPGLQKATASVSSATPERNSRDNSDEHEFEVIGLPSLHVSAGTWSGVRLEPDQTVSFGAHVGNYGATATNVVLTMRLSGGAVFTAAKPNDAGVTCTLAPTEIVCTHPLLEYAKTFGVTVDLRTPNRLTGGQIEFSATAHAAEGDFSDLNNAASFKATLVRHLVVTNTSDEGAGSLRQALLDAQALCQNEWCTVAFRIPGTPENGRFVIQPRSALPEVRGYVEIDGATQTTFGGDTNPDGPEIEINGAFAGNAHGLLLGTGCEIHVTDLAITGFAYPGIEGRRGPFSFDDCRAYFLESTVIARNHLRGNYRGLVLVGSPYVTIKDNVIADNERAGLFIARGYYAEIHRNRVTGNGASGMFLDIGTRDYVAGGAHVEENVIANNGEWGIARTPLGELAIRKNSIHDNRYLGIDVNLDFVTPNRNPDDTRNVPNAPVLFSAQYDAAANKTIVRGHITTYNLIGAGVEIDVYASDSLSLAGHAEAEQWVGSVRVTGGSTIDTDFTIEVEGDLRGKLITATSTRAHIIGWAKPPQDDVTSNGHSYSVPSDTSELSNVVTAF